MNLLIELATVKWEPIIMNQETPVIFHGFMRILPPVLRVIQHRDLLYKDGALIEELKGKLESKFVSFLLLFRKKAHCFVLQSRELDTLSAYRKVKLKVHV